MDSSETLYELLLQQRSVIVWVLSILVALLVFWLIRRQLRKGEPADFPDIDLGLFNLTTVFGGDGGSSEQLRETLLKIVKSKWGKIFITAGVVAVLFLFAVKYTLDASTKKYIESQLTFPTPLCQRTARDSVLLFIHGWNGDLKETWQQ